MMEIKGKVNTAICYANIVEDEAVEQIRRMCDYPFTEGSKIRIMPDVHAGTGCTIGTTMTIGDRAVPSLVGVDIGCGMEAILLEEKSIDFDRLDKVIRGNVPSGQSIRKSPHSMNSEIDLSMLRCRFAINMERAIQHAILMIIHRVCLNPVRLRRFS